MGKPLLGHDFNLYSSDYNYRSKPASRSRSVDFSSSKTCGYYDDHERSYRWTFFKRLLSLTNGSDTEFYHHFTQNWPGRWFGGVLMGKPIPKWLGSCFCSKVETCSISNPSHLQVHQSPYVDHIIEPENGLPPRKRPFIMSSKIAR